MADALTKLEILSKSYQFYTGGQDLLDNMTKVKAFAGKDPKDFKEAKKVFGLAAEKYKPLRVYLSKIQEEVLAAVKGGFPEIPNPALKARANMEKVAKSKGPNGPGFELELDLYIKHLTRYERALAERLSFMRIVKDKCDLNIKNFTQMDRIISSTLKLLKAIFVAIPEAQTKAGVEILNIMQSNIENKPKL